MDPNATLKRIQEIVAICNKSKHVLHGHVLHGVELIELIESLDNWIVNGGTFPDAWSNLTIEQRKLLLECKPE